MGLRLTCVGASGRGLRTKRLRHLRWQGPLMLDKAVNNPKCGSWIAFLLLGPCAR